MSKDNNDKDESKRLSRRNLLKGERRRRRRCRFAGGEPGAGEERAFVNGRIHTMDDENRVVSSLAIRDGRSSQMRETRPVLTVVDGKIVYDAGA